MTSQPPPVAHEPSESPGVGITFYRSDRELALNLRALGRVKSGEFVVVLGLGAGTRLVPGDVPANVRLIQTVAQLADIDTVLGALVPDPLHAVQLALAKRHPTDGLLLILPADWQGPVPEELVATAQRRAAVARSRVEPQAN